MIFAGKPAPVWHRLRHPQATVRWRLTLLYGGLFLVCGAGLLTITYALVDRANTQGPANRAFSIVQGPAAELTERAAAAAKRAFPRRIGPAPPLPPRLRQFLRTSNGQAAVRFGGSGQRIADMHQLQLESAIALAIMAVISGALGWLVAGRVLRPLRTMTATAQQISEVNLYERLAMPGPRDELRQLGDTIDGLLERLQGAFDAQRRFVANASHELRTPLTVSRAMLEMVISDPEATVETFRATCEMVLEESGQQEQLIDALLGLAHGQRGIDNPEPLDLAAIVIEALQTHDLEAAAQGLQVDVSLNPAPICGDQRLIERLVSNLLENALRHNIPDGRVWVRVETPAGRPILAIANTGPLVPAEEVQRLLQPFQRLASDRVGHHEGLGLGLSIVAAIAAAHEATLEVHAGRHGGLEIEVGFPHAPDTPEADPPSVEPHLTAA
ncbi:MAG TPA: HAMP domain-containing sensor histidine kinase [Solirubrobacteraceae bacterium]|nr:HAMP domain-containing sensor histidine kinase [Solirubrobacteraceae bacterium]